MTYFSPELFKSSSNIFVFGSNKAGRHGAGAAKFAKEYCGAVYGRGFGLQGRSFAIPTKNEYLATLPMQEIYTYVQSFLQFAKQSPHLTFYVTEIGCGLAGYTPIQIAPMFIDVPSNVILPERFKLNKPLPLLDSVVDVG